MDIALYIGQFLLKNRFCYLHGLGNLEFIKKAAYHDGTALQAPQYEVRLTPAGSIDDNLANYIATNEQISISKAANALREFSTEARGRLQAGEEVPIPGIGHFIQSEGEIHFITDPGLLYVPQGIPVVKSALKEEEEIDYYDIHQQGRKTSRSWGKILLLFLLLTGVGLAIYFGINNGLITDSESSRTAMTPSASSGTEQTPSSTPRPVPPSVPAEPTETETRDQEPAAPPSRFLILINSYTQEEAAERRYRQLTSYGNQVELKAEDSTRFLILLPLDPALRADSLRILDSLSRLFNPSGVSVYTPAGE